MNTERIRALSLALLPLLAACQHDMPGAEPASAFGEANRQTLMAQVVDPDPQYADETVATSAEHAAQAVDRYRRDAVKKPEKLRSTSISSGSAGSAQ